MVVMCLSVPLMRRMWSAMLRLGKFASRSCSTSLIPWLSSFRFSVGGFMVYCKSALIRSVQSGSPAGFPYQVTLFAFDVCVHTCSLFASECCQHLHVWLPNAKHAKTS